MTRGPSFQFLEEEREEPTKTVQESSPDTRILPLTLPHSFRGGAEFSPPGPDGVTPSELPKKHPSPGLKASISTLPSSICLQTR